MTVEQLVRDQLDRATRDVPRGPALDTAVRLGRRKRGQRRGGLALAALAVVGLGGVGARAIQVDDGKTVAQDLPVADAPAAASADDFVPGTDIDDTMAAVIAERLPALPRANDVFPSDSHTAGPIPDADFAQAEDWQATYTLDNSTFLVLMAQASEGPLKCPGCEHQAVPGGTVYHQKFRSEGQDWFGVYFARADGFVVNAFEAVPGHDGNRQLADADVVALVQDPRLTFG